MSLLSSSLSFSTVQDLGQNRPVGFLFPYVLVYIHKALQMETCPELNAGLYYTRILPLLATYSTALNNSVHY